MDQNFKYQKGNKGRGLVWYRRLAYGARAFAYSWAFIAEKDALLGKSKPKSDLASQLMNDICNATNGRGLEAFSKVVNILVRKQTKMFDTNISKLRQNAKLSDAERKTILKDLRQYGFAKIPNFASSDQAKEMYLDIMKSPGKDRSGGEFSMQKNWLDNASSPRIDADRKAVAIATEKQNLDFASLELIAREYLNCRPIKLGPNSWTTKATGELTTDSLDTNAMAFHSDSDYFGFVKAFMLLTEVDLNSGPFTFIAESHKGKRQVQGRLRDSDLGYKESDVRLGTGKPGDLVLAITTGWHKASVPKKGHRMMVQWLFSNSLFGSATQ